MKSTSAISPPIKSFVVIGSTATASPEFLLDDLPGSSGRLDVLLRCVRAALLFSHGLRTDVLVYLVLRGGAAAPRVLRVGGESARFIRPDERSLALLVQKTLRASPPGPRGELAEVRPGVFLAEGDLECVVADLGTAPRYLLEEQAPDIRSSGLVSQQAAYFLGDHLGFDAATRAALTALGARPISIGPRSLHTEDAIVVLSNELDRLAPQ